MDKVLFYLFSRDMLRTHSPYVRHVHNSYLISLLLTQKHSSMFITELWQLQGAHMYLPELWTIPPSFSVYLIANNSFPGIRISGIFTVRFLYDIFHCTISVLFSYYWSSHYKNHIEWINQDLERKTLHTLLLKALRSKSSDLST